jgi:hypothetical protein
MTKPKIFSCRCLAAETTENAKSGSRMISKEECELPTLPTFSAIFSFDAKTTPERTIQLTLHSNPMK